MTPGIHLRFQRVDGDVQAFTDFERSMGVKKNCVLAHFPGMDPWGISMELQGKIVESNNPSGNLEPSAASSWTLETLR